PNFASLLPKPISRVLYVANKMDLLSGHGKSNQEAVKKLLNNPENITWCSAKTGWNVPQVRELIVKLSRGENVFMMGRTNVGKSLLYKTVSLRPNDLSSSVAREHGTTVGVSTKTVCDIGSEGANDSQMIFDLPGSQMRGPGDMSTDILSREEA